MDRHSRSAPPAWAAPPPAPARSTSSTTRLNPPIGPTLVGGGLPGTTQISILPGVFGEDSASGAIGLVTLDTVAANGVTGFPQYYRSRLLNTATEYPAGSPDTAASTTNVRLTTASASSDSPTLNSLFVDVGGSLAITAGTTVTLTSGTFVMAGGTSITGGTLAAPTDADLTLYVGAGTATLGSDVATSSARLPATPRTLAKTGPGMLVVTSAIGATPARRPGTIAIQRGTLQLGAGGSLPTTANVSVDAGATFDLNSPGATVTINRLVGLGTVLLGSDPATNLQITVPSTAPATAVFGGTITGSGSIEKLAPEHWNLADRNYSGPITLTAGTCCLATTVAFPRSSRRSPAAPSPPPTAPRSTIVAVQNFARPININVGPHREQ